MEKIEINKKVFLIINDKIVETTISDIKKLVINKEVIIEIHLKDYDNIKVRLSSLEGPIYKPLKGPVIGLTPEQLICVLKEVLLSKNYQDEDIKYYDDKLNKAYDDYILSNEEPESDLYFPTITVGDLKEIIKDLPDDAKVFVERVHDYYYDKLGWKCKYKKDLYDYYTVVDKNNDKKLKLYTYKEYSRATYTNKYDDDNNLYIDLHF